MYELPNTYNELRKSFYEMRLILIYLVVTMHFMNYFIIIIINNFVQIHTATWTQ